MKKNNQLPSAGFMVFIGLALVSTVLFFVNGFEWNFLVLALIAIVVYLAPGIDIKRDRVWMRRVRRYITSPDGKIRILASALFIVWVVSAIAVVQYDLPEYRYVFNISGVVCVTTFLLLLIVGLRITHLRKKSEKSTDTEDIMNDRGENELMEAVYATSEGDRIPGSTQYFIPGSEPSKN